MHKCKWCGNSCKLKQYGDHELAMCSSCFKEWERMVER